MPFFSVFWSILGKTDETISAFPRVSPRAHP
jgi:hypothetical protein